jgi:hypothetical protein
MKKCSAFEKCSDYQLWHCFFEIQSLNFTWTMTSSFGGNEIKAGNPTPPAGPVVAPAPGTKQSP